MSTSKVRVLDLVGTEVAGRTAQVRTSHDWPGWREGWRTISAVEVVNILGTEWLYLRWERKKTNEMDGFDCGYGGRRMDFAADWVIEMEDL